MTSSGARASRPRPPGAKRFPRRSRPTAHAPCLRPRNLGLYRRRHHPCITTAPGRGKGAPRARTRGRAAGGPQPFRPPYPGRDARDDRAPPPTSPAPTTPPPRPAAPPAAEAWPTLPAPPPSRHGRAPLPARRPSPSPPRRSACPARADTGVAANPPLVREVGGGGGQGIDGSGLEGGGEGGWGRCAPVRALLGAGSPEGLSCPEGPLPDRAQVRSRDTEAHGPPLSKKVGAPHCTRPVRPVVWSQPAWRLG